MRRDEGRVATTDVAQADDGESDLLRVLFDGGEGTIYCGRTAPFSSR